MNLDDALVNVSRLGVDTAPIIYFVERHPTYHDIVRELFGRVDSGQIAAYTSVISLGEVLVQPLRLGNRHLYAQYREILMSSVGFRTVAVTAHAAERAASIRATYRTHLPDALQLAIAIEEGCEAFLTNDRRLRQVSEIRVLLLDDLTI